MIWSIILLPFLAFLAAGIISIFSNKLENSNSLNFLAWLITTIATGLSAVFSLWFLMNMIKMEETTIVYELHDWFISGNLIVNLDFVFDKLVIIMVFVVAFISFLVHFYSYFYIAKEDNLARFQAYLSLFTFSMIMLVTSSNLIQMFIGWELISFCSYLLIVFWYKAEAPKKASAKAFLVNRFADIGYLLGTFAIFALIGSVNFADINLAVANVAWVHFNIFGIDISYIDFIAISFLLAAFAKSSQIILHIWLPDAMEAPTPVSALLHAATMVTAGVFLVIKLAPIYELSGLARNIILVFAGITALYGALVACMQKDIKRIIAYSTMSQLGYMFLAIGVGAFSAAFFHLFTHAFFKALLFLGAGSVIHGMNGEQNINKMGNLWRKMPLTYICMVVGFLALIGIPGFAGFYSKEAILNYIYKDEILSNYVKFAYYSAIIAVFFTSFYSLRLIINVFHLKENYNKEHIHVHESPLGILVVLVTLAILSVLTGTFLYDSFVGETSQFLWSDLYFTIKTLPKDTLEHHIEYLTLGLVVFAFLLTYVIYIREKGLSNKMKKTFPSVYNLVLNKFYFDEIYEYCIVNPSLKISRMFGKFDDNLYDKYGINVLASFMYRISRTFSSLQTGFINFYAVVMVLGVFLILTYCFFILGIK
ncbi:MAG: NADH-quinone oxidoreductase subunit L [Alphaproteobacteria bacterium]|jgi:NADH-quinone oxidoreductase subunit L|nr:NADH-quinone oxidoreductase subunit L [Alphaproteobacteria bacterium]